MKGMHWWGGQSKVSLTPSLRLSPSAASSEKWVSVFPWPSLWESYEVEIVNGELGNLAKLESTSKSIGEGVEFEHSSLSFMEL